MHQQNLIVGDKVHKPSKLLRFLIIAAAFHRNTLAPTSQAIQLSIVCIDPFLLRQGSADGIPACF